MQLKIRQNERESAFSEVTRLQALERAVPRQMVAEVLQEFHCQEQRCRKMSMCLVVYLVLAMNLFARERLALVLERLLHTWRWFFDAGEVSSPGDSAIHQRRDQLGVRPIVALFHRACRPLATHKTRGAFLGTLRKMALDSKSFNLYDSPELADYFGRPQSGRGVAAFPQMRLVSLEEIGTHATLDSIVWPIASDEHKGAKRLCRSLGADMVVYCDRGLYSADLVLTVQKQGAHLIARLSASVRPQVLKRLPDGSLLVAVSRWGERVHRREETLLLRMIVYKITDPVNPGYGRTYRLVTTLLDYHSFPGQEIAISYHERWDIEETYDELEIHLLHGDAPLRSRTVCGVLQEIYGLLIAHYALRALMHEAALRVDIDPDAISFTATVSLVQEAIRDFQLAPECLHAPLFARLLREIASHRVPQRKPRSNPRVVKRKMSNFPLKRPKDRGYQKCLPYRKAISLI
jgi:hypothetical protein